MKPIKIFEHHAYYLVEIVMLVAGLILLFAFSHDVKMQFLILIFLLLSYITIGFIHHRVNHYFSAKIVVEYVLIAALILAGFLLLNIGRL